MYGGGKESLSTTKIPTGCGRKERKRAGDSKCLSVGELVCQCDTGRMVDRSSLTPRERDAQSLFPSAQANGQADTCADRGNPNDSCLNLPTKSDTDFAERSDSRTLALCHIELYTRTAAVVVTHAHTPNIMMSTHMNFSMFFIANILKLTLVAIFLCRILFWPTMIFGILQC